MDQVGVQKVFGKLDIFDGADDKWGDWSMVMRAYAGAVNAQMLAGMGKLSWLGHPLIKMVGQARSRLQTVHHNKKLSEVL